MLKIHLHHFVEEMKENGFSHAFRKALQKYINLNRVVVPTYKDLSSVQDPGKPDMIEKIEFLIVNKENVDKVVSMYGVESRRLKAIHNVAIGYTAFVVAVNNEIVGDIWWATTPPDIGTRPIHPDLKWLGIDCGEKDTYMFDMYVCPKQRGKAISNYLLGKALFILRERGFSKAYGYYENQNLSALWAHRVAGYTEMKKRKIRQVLFYRTTALL
jgi:GNAT superfamily N-acetyltransferase